MSRKRSKRGTKPQIRTNDSRRENSFTQNSRKPDEIASGMQSERDNLPEWYAGNIGMLRDSASFPFSLPVGLPVYMTDAGGTFDLNLPGIACMHLIPGISRCEFSNSAFNVAANACFQYIRKVNAGAKNYEAPDLGIYLITMGSMISYITYLTRLYGMCMLYDSRNRYFPKYLVESQHVDYDSIVGNLAEFRLFINMLIAKVQSLPLPATMPYFKRMAFIFQNYYMEGQSIKDQIYMYIPSGFFKFAYDSDSAGMAKFMPMDYSQNLTYTDLIAYGNDLVNALIYDTDISIIGGDMRKAYSENQLVHLADIPVDYRLLPIHDDMFNYQFKNATVLGADVSSIDNLDIVQNSAKTDVLYTPEIKLDTQDALWTRQQPVFKRLCGDRLFTLDMAEPTPDWTMECSRLMTTAQWKPDGVRYVHVPLYPGAEMANRLELWRVENNVLTNSNMAYMDVYNESVTELEKQFDAARQYAAYKYLPPVNMFRFNAAWTTLQAQTYIHSIDNFTVLSILNVQKMHEVAMLSMCRVEEMAIQG